MTTLNALVQEELADYPREERGSAWRYFRMSYAALRLNSLGRRPEIENSPEVVRREAARLVRQQFPDFDGSVPEGTA